MSDIEYMQAIIAEAKRKVPGQYHYEVRQVVSNVLREDDIGQVQSDKYVKSCDVRADGPEGLSLFLSSHWLLDLLHQTQKYNTPPPPLPQGDAHPGAVQSDSGRRDDKTVASECGNWCE